jgi:hypothetical protein
MPKKNDADRSRKNRRPRGLKVPDLPCDVEVPKFPPPPKPPGSGCSTGTGFKQYKDLLRGKR